MTMMQLLASHHKIGDKYHPAIFIEGIHEYWPNVTQPTAYAAYLWATLAIHHAFSDVFDDIPLIDSVNEWNIYLVE
jgi:hypothetical protein